MGEFLLKVVVFLLTALIGGWSIMIAAGFAHAASLPLPALGYWQSVAVAWLLMVAGTLWNSSVTTLFRDLAE